MDKRARRLPKKLLSSQAPPAPPDSQESQAPSGIAGNNTSSRNGRGANKMKDLPDKPEDRYIAIASGQTGIVLDAPRPGRFIQTQMGLYVRTMSNGQETWGKWKDEEREALLKKFYLHFQWKLDD